MKILDAPRTMQIARRHSPGARTAVRDVRTPVGGNGYAFTCLSAWIIAVLVYTTGSYRTQLPLAILPMSVFFFGHVVIRGIRFDHTTPLTPGNVAQVIFFLQLVVIPLLIVTSGFAPGVLPYLPNAQAIDTAVVVQCVAFVSFIGGYVLTTKKPARPEGTRRGQTRVPVRTLDAEYPTAVGIIFAAIGIVGFLQIFSSWTVYTAYLADPIGRIALFEPKEGTVQGAVSTFFRPFLPFSAIFFWTRWVDRNEKRYRRWDASLFTAIVIGVSVIANLSYSFNRGALIAPVLGILAIYSRTIRKIPVVVLITLGAAMFYGSLILGEYRGSKEEFQVADHLANQVEIVEWIQVYGSAPQYAGYLIQHMSPERGLLWGKTIVASLLHPVPVLGKSFRQSSGVELYNRLIYGVLPSSDQVIPSPAEWYINFHFPGVVGAFVVLGIFLSLSNNAFLRTRNSYIAYSLFLISVWLSFGVMSSIAVLSQIFIYFFWPVYIYVLWMVLGQRAVVRRSPDA